MRYLLHLALALAACAGAFQAAAQNSLDWRNVGPDNLGARTRAIAFHPNGTLYAGAVGGGLWTSADGGLSWTLDAAYQQAGGNPHITAIAIAPNGTIYVGTGETEFFKAPTGNPMKTTYGSSQANFTPGSTGEGFAGHTGLPGEGVFVGTGGTWSNNNATRTSYLQALDPQRGAFTGIQKIVLDGSRIYLGTRKGLYVSDDNLATATPVLVPGSNLQGKPVYDIELATAGANQKVVLAATLDTTYVSFDGGANFEPFTNDNSTFIDNIITWPKGDVGTRFAVGKNNPNIIYAAAANLKGELNGIWRTDDLLLWGNALTLDGADDYMEVPDAGLANAGTVEFWFYMNQNPASSDSVMLLGKHDGGMNGLAIYLNKARKISAKFNNATILSDRGAAINARRWYHVALSYTLGGTANLMLNGTTVATASNVPATPLPADALLVGKSNVAGWKQANMRIDELRLWDNARSRDQVVLNLTTKLSTGMARYYTFDDAANLATEPNASGSAGGATLAGGARKVRSRDNFRLYSPSGGGSFTPLGTTSGHAFTLEVFPDNDNDLIVAGNAWYTYSQANGWQQTAQHTSPFQAQFGGRPFIPTPIHTVVFDPANSNRFFIGTDKAIYYSADRGVTTASRTKGYEGLLTQSVTSTNDLKLGYDRDYKVIDTTLNLEAVVAATPDHGLLYNQYYNQSSGPNPQSQGFGGIYSTGRGRVDASFLRPGALLSQGRDKADGSDLTLVRSTNFGEVFEAFYGAPLPRVPKRIKVNDDSLDSYSYLWLLNIKSEGDSIIDRNRPYDGYASLRNVPSNFPVTTWVLDERIPASHVTDSLVIEQQVFDNPFTPQADPELRALARTVGGFGKDSIAKLPSYAFFATREYLWRIDYPFSNPNAGDPLPAWTRITERNMLGGQGTEIFTALAVAPNDEHTLYAGTNKGNLFRINRPLDFYLDTAGKPVSNYDAKVNIRKLNGSQTGLPTNRWITDIAIDPSNTARVLVAYAGYGGTTPSYLFATDNVPNDSITPNAFVPITDNLNELTVPIYALQYVPSGDTLLLLLGNEDGLFSAQSRIRAATPAATLREELGANAPGFGRTPVMDIYVQRYKPTFYPVLTKDADNKPVNVEEMALLRDGTVFVASWGKGVWMTDDLSVNGKRTGTAQPEGPATTQAILFPNPTATGQATLRAYAPTGGSLRAELLDLRGTRLGLLADIDAEAGYTDLRFNTAILAPGLYVVNVTINGAQTSLKLMVE